MQYNLNTAECLREEFGTLYPKVARVANEYMGLEEKAAKRIAALGGMPFPVFKMGKSQRAPWLVDVRDLAKYLDTQCRENSK